MQVMKDIGGIEMPEYLAKFASEQPRADKPSTNGTPVTTG
jgi:flotillin